MPIENFAEVQEYLTTNNIEGNEVKTYMDSLKVSPTLEVFKGLANTNVDFKSFMDSEKDKHSAKNMDTWKTNNLDKIYQERFAKENPSADPKDVEFAKYKSEQEIKNKAMEDRFNAAEKKSLRESLTNKALKTAQEKKLPTDLIDFFVGADDDITTKNMEKLIATMAKHDEAIKLEFAKGNSYVPPVEGVALTGNEKVRADIAKWMK